MKLNRCFLLTWLAISSLTYGSIAAESEVVETDHVKSQLISSVTAIEPGKPFDVALRFEIDEHWHTYYKNPGDSGLATSIDWELPKGFTASEIFWPYPQRLPFGPLTNFGYEGTVLHLVTITPPASLESGKSVTLKAEASWLVCEEICIPGSGNYELRLDVAETAVTSTWNDRISEQRQKLPTQRDSHFARTDDRLLILVPNINQHSQLVFFPDEEGLIDNTGQQLLTPSDKHVLLTVPLAENAKLPEILEGIIVATDETTPFDGKSSARISAQTGDIELIPTNTTSGFLPTLLLGFIGGLILNLMPCVFPVLGIKVMGFVQQAGEDRKKVVAHGLTFTAGVLVSFWTLAGVLLALRAGGQELGWGFQLQSPSFVFALMVFLFAFGLNLAGVFEFGTSAVGVGSKLTGSGALSGSFFSGVLATVVATPCAAPFLAPALGAALSLPAPSSLMLFTSIALGLAAPYLILSLKPELTHFLPKPGAWMETFKQAMAFPLFGTAAYLLWVLDGQVGENQLLRIFFALAGIGLALWIYGRWSTPVRSDLSRKVGTIVAGVVLLGTLVYAWPQTKVATLEWQPWSKSLEQSLIEDDRIVYVDFTARWCATCQTNKALVFSNPQVIETFKEQNIATLKADWTNQDPEITKELARYNRSAVPFNLIYRPGESEPTILPELLTPGIVLEALKD